MSQRAAQLSYTAQCQIAELTDVLSTGGEAVLGRPCPGREKLGDGSVAACAQHIAETYDRIAGFIGGDSGAGHAGAQRHDMTHGATSVSLPKLLGRLSDARQALSEMEKLTDEQLDSVPPSSPIRFADGQRTLEQVLTGMLRHQARQIDAVTAATREQPAPKVGGL